MLKTESKSDESMRGFVRGYYVDGNGGRYDLFSRPNQLSYACADAMAQLMGGNVNYAPGYIGFIYGTDSSPADLTDPTLRTQSWTNLTAELKAIGGNVQISPLTMTPSVMLDGSSTEYSANSTVFTAHTMSGVGGVYGMPLAAPFAGVLTTNSYLYHAVLLVKLNTGSISYVPVARVTLGTAGGVYSAKPDGFELALDWKISFF